MSDNNERAFLKDKFKDFSAVSSDATKSAVMSKIQTKSRRKRFILLFLFSAFVIGVSALTIHLFFNENKINGAAIAKNSKKLNDKITDSSFAKTDLNKFENQGTTNEIFSNDKRDFTETQSDVKQPNLKSDKLSSGKNRPSIQKDLTDKELNTIASKKGLINGNPKKTITNNRTEESLKINESSVNTLNIKPFLLSSSSNMHYKLRSSASKTSSFRKSRWIIGVAFSYNNMRSSKLKNQISQNTFQPPIPNNSPDELSTNQNLFEVSSIMNLDVSVIRKLKNRFHLESGIRYTNLYSFNTDERMHDHVLGIPIKIAYTIPLKNRLAFDLSTGVNYNLSILKSEGNSNNTSSNFANFQLSTLEFNVGLSYFISEKISIKLSPQFNYLLFLKEQNTTRNFQKNFWFGGQFGLYFQLD